MSGNEGQPRSLRAAVITVSDTRTEADDTSGDLLAQCLDEAGHQLVFRRIVRDDLYRLRAEIAHLIAESGIEVILVTGGTGFSRRDNTVAAVTPLLDSQIDGFGEIFRQLSYAEIGSSTIQSRAFAGVSNGTVVFCMPGSPGACRTAWNGLIAGQLDSGHRPCNFAELIARNEH